MDTLHPTAEWESVGDRWFRKTQTYTEVFDQDLDLDNYVVTGAPFAGALGMEFSPNFSHRPGPQRRGSWVHVVGREHLLTNSSQHYGVMTPSSRHTSRGGL